MTQAARLRPLGLITAGMALLSWPFGFAQQAPGQAPELSLSQAIQIALESNRSVKLAQLDVTKSEWQVAETKTKRLPALSTELLATGDITSPTFTFPEGIFQTLNGAPNPSKNVHISLANGITGFALAKAAQPISQLYQIHLAVREQEFSTDIANQKYNQTEQSVVADVKQAYYAALQTESALDAARALVKQYEETQRVALQYVAQESILRSDSMDVKAKLAQAQYQIIILDDNLETQKEHLNDLLGRDLDTPFRTQPVPPVSLEEMDLKIARRTALMQRPEVKEAEINERRAIYDRKLAKSQYIPGVAAEIRYFTPINTEILPQNILAAGVDMTWEPFDWGRRRDDVKQKEIGIQQSQYQLEQTRSQVLLDVDNTFRKLTESRSLLAVAETARDAADERLREVNNQFKHSAVLLRDVLQQEAAVASADHDYEESLLSFWNADAEFERALGEQ
jgi:outer membrane protein TolC